jgi:hypothetical protein
MAFRSNAGNALKITAESETDQLLVEGDLSIEGFIPAEIRGQGLQTYTSSLTLEGYFEDHSASAYS